MRFSVEYYCPHCGHQEYHEGNESEDRLRNYHTKQGFSCSVCRKSWFINSSSLGKRIGVTQ